LAVALLACFVRVAPAAAQVQTFYVSVPASLRGEERDAFDECAERLNAALVNTGMFRANANVETQRTVSGCLSETGSPTAKRQCELSIANVEVDWLMVLSLRKIGRDWKWGARALSPAEGGAQKWGGDEKPSGVTDRVQAAYVACDGLGKQFACEQGVASACPVSTLAVVGSTPQTVNVWIDGKESGTSANRIPRIPSGLHSVTLKAAGYLDYTEELEFAAGGVTEMANVRMVKATATLTVTSNAVGAEVLIDGTVVGTTTGRADVFEISALAQKLELRRSGFAPFAARLSVEAGRSSEVTATLVESKLVPGGVCPIGYLRVASGSFRMGSPEDEEGRDDDETQHKVEITRAFCLKATEVTQEEWQAVMGANPSRFVGCGGDCPVEQVNWDEAVAFANTLSRKEGLEECYNGQTFAGLSCKGYRLPSEAEWEFAARAGTKGATYAALADVAWHDENSGAQPHRVGQKRPNAWGLYDMLGNVWEWTGDFYDAYMGEVTDPTGPWTGGPRVGRGGAWDASGRSARVAGRSGAAPGTRSGSIGFRLAITAP
jgi:hypothetical protein